MRIFFISLYQEKYSRHLLHVLKAECFSKRHYTSMERAKLFCHINVAHGPSMSNQLLLFYNTREHYSTNGNKVTAF